MSIFGRAKMYTSIFYALHMTNFLSHVEALKLHIVFREMYTSIH